MTIVKIALEIKKKICTIYVRLSCVGGRGGDPGVKEVYEKKYQV
jgi:hypothetical protein